MEAFRISIFPLLALAWLHLRFKRKILPAKPLISSRSPGEQTSQVARQTITADGWNATSGMRPDTLARSRPSRSQQIVVG